ncbi:MAG: fibronectin type III domain-containing protein, partial [Gracilibacteraceae bacterium]|nr:fibronectin type III domain-containing protein [Gracilibacteraceae bacterium]
MRKGASILLCVAILIPLWLPVNGDNSRLPAIPTLPGKTITQPKLPIPDSLPDSEPEPELELLTFTAPTDLTLVKAEEDLVSIQWEDTASAESKYVVERKESDGDYTQLAVLEKDATSYDDTSVEPGTTYYYRVKAGKDS